jgi:hypothetical protein
VKTAALALAALLALAACTAEEFYSAGQAYQRSQCEKIVDRVEYERCLKDADLAYDEYKRRKEEEEAKAR